MLRRACVALAEGAQGPRTTEEADSGTRRLEEWTVANEGLNKLSVERDGV